MHAQTPLEDSLTIIFSNHMGQAPNSIRDKWWKPGILPFEWEVTDKQKERLQYSCPNGLGWRHHHKLPLAECIQSEAGIHVYISTYYQLSIFTSYMYVFNIIL